MIEKYSDNNCTQNKNDTLKLKLILASGSKQRQDIFKNIGLKYEVIK